MSLSKSKHAVFRADASPILGSGHISRCLALANALSDQGWHCIFAVGPDTQSTYPALNQSEHTICTPAKPNSAASIAASLPITNANLLVVDHYNLDQAFETEARAWTKHIIAIDDLANRSHDCDILMDQTLGRKETDYRPLVPPHCRLLLGPHYAMLRPEFAELRTASLARRNGTINRILIAVGGSDPKDITALALDALEQAGISCQIDIVLGASSPNVQAIQNRIVQNQERITLYLDTPHMAHLMAQADLAIGACGVTSWERCTLGLPTLAVVIAENQRLAAKSLINCGAIVYAGDWTEISVESLTKHLHDFMHSSKTSTNMTRASQSVCNGMGTSNLVKIVSEL